VSKIENIKKKIIEDNLTLLAETTLDNVEFCIRSCIERGIEGDFIETGIWRGGVVILAYNLFKELGEKRKVFAADSFEGLPKPDLQNYPEDDGDTHWMDDNLRVTVEQVKENFKSIDGIDDSVVFLEGWFKDTLPTAPIDKLCVLRLDGDMYESTMEALVYLYPKLSVGGICIIDDFEHQRCKKAVFDYRASNNITDEMKKTDYDWRSEAVYWIKSK